MTAGFVHPAVFYRSDEEYLAMLRPFVTEGLAAAHAVAVAVPGRRLDLVRDSLGDLAHDVEWIDMAEAGRNPGTIIPTVLRRFADAYLGRYVRIVGEPVWPGRGADEYPACVQHEALINSAFAGRDITIVCPYDVTALEPRQIADARQTHPLVWEAGERHQSPQYAPQTAVRRFNLPLPRDSRVAQFVVKVQRDLRAARTFVAEQAARCGVGSRTADLQLIATELLSNCLRYASGDSRVRMWCTDEYVVCEVEGGGNLADPLAGRRPANDGHGRGLLLVNQLADLVRIYSSGHGTAVAALLRADRQTDGET
ncbi:anti-sigma factor RsbA family regulatory protein [Kribbella sp. NPDC059898]|uniref:anti-sigma factor RsbA family regulatory protein n=1 Tax=Kribbella sp. NPDC059898 TaxID=3346995 RepID=UPI003659796D